MGYIQLNRKFSDFEDRQLNEEAFYLASLPTMWWGAVTWKKLLESKYVVVLGEAGIGKTKEFQEQTRILNEDGRTTFFVELGILADEGIPEALDPSDEKRLEDWKITEDQAVFFLDSVDEARLQSPDAFERALRKFRRGLRGEWDRVRIVISCRISDWQAKADANTIKREIGISSINTKYDDSRKTTEETAGPKIRIVKMVPLNLEQVSEFARFLGIIDTDAFIEAIKEADADIFVGRPRDVQWIAEYWKERGSLGTITDLIEYNISKKLSEENLDRFQYDPLTPAKARKGAETLAAAAVLCKMYSFMLPDEDLSIAAPSSSIVPGEVLKDWELRELQALLTRAIFDDAIYGRVRFHHRSVTEYLAAKWFQALVQKGCSMSSILHIFFKEIFGSTIAVRSFIGVASWLASFSQDFSAVALKVEPVILFGGDPQQISPKYRARALSEFAERYKERKYSGWIFDNADLRRMAHPELTSTINSLLEEHKHSVDVRDLLLRIVRLGNLTGCSETAVSIALDSAQDELVRIEAIRCLAAIASMEQKSKLAYYTKTTKELSNSLIAAFCEALFPEVFSVADCLSLISRAKREIRNAQTMLPYVIEKEIVSKCPKENLLELLDGLLELSRQPPPKNLHGKKVISELFWWIPNVIGKAFVRVLQELNPEAIPLKALKSVLFLLQFCHTYKEPFIHDLDYISDELQKHSWLRRKFYWARLKAKREEIVLFGRILPGRVHDLCPLLVEDFDWLIEEINAQPSLEYRKKALESALDLWALEREMKSELAQKILDSTKGTTELHSIAQSAIYRKPGKWEKRYALIQQTEEEKVQKRKRIQLEEARRHLSPKIDQIRSGDAFHEIYYLWNYADSKTEREGSAQWGKASYEVLIPDFGKAMAEAAKKGFEATWRRWRPPLPHEMKDLQRIKYGTLVGLTGLRIEAEEGLDFSILSTEEAKNAAHYALRELNGFPEWFPSLVNGQPAIVSEVLLAAFSNEMLEDPKKEKRHEVISYIQYQPAEVLNFCAPLLLELLHSIQPNHVRTLESSLRIVLSSSPVDSKQVAELAKREVQCFVRKRDYEFLIPWVVAWLHVDPNEAWDFVAKTISSLEKADFVVMALASSLEEPFGEDQQLSIPSYYKPIVLRRMIPIFYLYIRPEDDIWHEDTYSPIMRDHAQSFRSRLPERLAQIEGYDAHLALVELANDKSLAKQKDYFLRLVEQHAANAAEPKPWGPQDIIDFAQAFEKEPQNPLDLFNIALARLDDLRWHIESGDFSERGLFQDGEPEENIQKWLAARLKEASRNRYTVHREEEVYLNKEPDIRLHHPRAGNVGIEVKPTDRYSYSKLLSALRDQLAGKYLRAIDSRYGIFFLANLKERKWDPRDGTGLVDFQGLLEKLDLEANELARTNGNVEKVAVKGIDFVAPN